MKAIRMLTAAAALALTAGICSVGAEEKAPQDSSSAARGMMGRGGMGPGMMGYDGMGPGMMGYDGMGTGMMGSRWAGSRQQMCTAMAGHIDGRLAYLKAELKITDAQEVLWKAYAAAAHENADAMLKHCTAMTKEHGGAALSLPERLDQHEQFMAARLESLRATNKSLKPLYAAFSDSQKQTADQLFWGPMGIGMGMM